MRNSIAMTTGPIHGAERGALTSGAIVAERYRIEGTLGEGGMGVVYLAEHVHMRKRYALKVLLPKWTENEQVLARFEREAVAAGQIDHPNVVAATDFGRLDDGAFFLVLEHVDGKMLRTLLDELGVIAPARAFHIARGVLCAVAAAHAKGIVHRDLKPENVMLVTHDDDSDFVKVLDFGIAKIDFVAGQDGAPAGLTQAGMVIGTPDYMPPEQALGGVVDARSDLYSIGVILFEMLSGARPFTGGAVTLLRQHVMEAAPPLSVGLAPHLDERIAAVVARLLEKDPAARFATAVEAVAALDVCSAPARAGSRFGRADGCAGRA